MNAVDLALVVCFLMGSMTAVQSQIRKGPVNSLNKTGDSVTLQCVTVNTNCDQVEWSKVEGLQSPKLVYRNGIGMLNNETYPPKRYSVNSIGGCSLTITQLVINDSGRFMCKHAPSDGEEETRSSILIVINVEEACQSNVASNALAKDDGYSLWSAIKVPPKSVEPSNVTVAFHIKTANETETTDEKPPLTLKTTLTGTATKENITRACKASFPPNGLTGYDISTATLDICTIQWIVSYPVENVAGSLLPGKGDTIHCTADGHPPPTFKWTIWKSGAIVDGDTLLITEAGGNYTCTATNTFKGTPVSKDYLYEVGVPPPPGGLGPGAIAGIVIGTILGVGIIAGVTDWKYEWSPLYGWLRSRKTNDRNGAKADAGQPLNDTTSGPVTYGKPESAYTSGKSGPPKPPRGNDDAPQDV